MLFLNVAFLEKIKKLVYEVPAPDKTNNESIKWTRSHKYYFKILCKASISGKTYAVK